MNNRLKYFVGSMFFLSLVACVQLENQPDDIAQTQAKLCLEVDHEKFIDELNSNFLSTGRYYASINKIELIDKNLEVYDISFIDTGDRLSLSFWLFFTHDIQTRRINLYPLRFHGGQRSFRGGEVGSVTKMR